LYDTVALIDLLAQYFPQVATFRLEDVLPDRFVTEKHQRVSHELARASQLGRNCRNENRWTRRHREKAPIKSILILQV
jgi:hypothetical protein